MSTLCVQEVVVVFLLLVHCSAFPLGQISVVLILKVSFCQTKESWKATI